MCCPQDGLSVSTSFHYQMKLDDMVQNLHCKSKLERYVYIYKYYICKYIYMLPTR